MQNAGKLLLALVLCLVATGCATPGKAVLSEAVLAQAGLTIYWPLERHGILDEGESIKDLWLLDENLYCLTNTNRLIAIDAATGTAKWFHVVAEPGECVFGPRHFDGMALSAAPLNVAEISGVKSVVFGASFDAVLINSVRQVLVMDRANGRVWRTIPLASPAGSSGATDGVYYYVGTTTGRYHAFALNEALPAWSLLAGDMISAGIGYSDEHVFVASHDGYLYCAQTGRQGKRIWKQALLGMPVAGFHVDARGCFVPTRGNRLYGFDAMGNRLWDPVVAEGEMVADVQVGEKTIFQYAKGDGLYAIDIANGRRRWRRPEGRLVVAMGQTRVYIVTADGTLVVLDEILGRVEHSVPMTGIARFVGNVASEAIYVATEEGKLMCIRPGDAERLTAKMLRGE